MALQAKAPYSKRVNTAAQDATCEWRLCAHPLFASSALSRAKHGGSTCNAGRSANHTITLQSKQRTAQLIGSAGIY